VRPLDPLRSIKVKLGVVIVAAVAVAFAVNEIGVALNYSFKVRVVVATLLSLLMVQLLAHGMTSPLRDMAGAARAMARGDYSRRVRATARDEVGDLAHAFNRMAAELAEVDRQRRDLVANASHELRTPITALQALLENLVDGVEQPDAVRRWRRPSGSACSSASCSTSRGWSPVPPRWRPSRCRCATSSSRPSARPSWPAGTYA